MITGIRLRNFKSLSDTGFLNIRPLTFLVGPNSSGKSSLLQFLLVLKQTIDSADSSVPLLLNGDVTQAGPYPEIVFKGHISRPLTVDLTITGVLPVWFNRPLIGETDSLSLAASFEYDPITTEVFLAESRAVIKGKASQHLIRMKTGNGYSWVFNSQVAVGRRTLRLRHVRPIRFYHAAGVASLLSRTPPRTEHIISNIRSAMRQTIEDNLLSISHVGPLREFPKRIHLSAGQTPREVGPRGEHAVDILWFSTRSRDKKIHRIQREAQRWFKAFGFARDLHFDVLGAGDYYRVRVTDPVSRSKVNLADIGFGGSQTIPVIVECLQASPGSLVLIEQPEIHLHPEAQATLGDLFVEAAVGSQRFFVIETHSDHLLARIRRRIAERKFSRRNLAIYYFRRTPHGAEIQEVTVNAEGQYEGFPSGFFEEDVLEAFEHLKAIRSRG